MTSPIAIGTHLGEMNIADSNLYRQSISYALKNGINFIDTAINYRGMRSERDIGFVLKKLIYEENVIHRNKVIISTKAGIIPGDIEANLVPKDYLKTILLDQQIITESDLNVVDHHHHVLAPSYFEFAIQQSRSHLHLDTIDIYYLHNPEISMIALGEERFYKKLEHLLNFFESQVKKGTIRFYGIATWTGLTCDPKEAGYISLERVVSIAHKVNGEKHHFKFIQFPLNSNMPEAQTTKNQKVNDEWHTLINAAKLLGIHTTTSSPFHLGTVLKKGGDPKRELREILNTNGILATMVGMKNVNHVKENMKLLF